LYDTKNKSFIVSVGTDRYEKSIFKNKKNIILPPPRSTSRIRRREEAALGLVVAEVGKEGVGGCRSASWSPRWRRRASVGAARGRGHRGGEGGRRWAPLILVVVEVGKEGIGGSRSSSWSPRWGRRASVGRRRPPLPRHAAAYRLRLTKPSDRHAAAYRADCRLAKTREKERRERTE
jgi:hypothetical protein